MKAEEEHKFGNILKDLRKNAKITQEEISALLNVDRSNIANYEAGKRLPPIDSLIKIAQYFNVSVDYLLFGKKLEDDPQRSDKDKRELMAENTLLMQSELTLLETIEEKEKEIKVLKDLITSLKQYNDYLEKKLNSNQVK